MEFNASWDDFRRQIKIIIDQINMCFFVSQFTQSFME